jgi:hypothetical protein
MQSSGVTIEWLQFLWIVTPDDSMIFCNIYWGRQFCFCFFGVMLNIVNPRFLIFIMYYLEITPKNYELEFRLSRITKGDDLSVGCKLTPGARVQGAVFRWLLIVSKSRLRNPVAFHKQTKLSVNNHYVSPHSSTTLVNNRNSTLLCIVGFRGKL